MSDERKHCLFSGATGSWDGSVIIPLTQAEVKDLEELGRKRGEQMRPAFESYARAVREGREPVTLREKMAFR